AESLPLPDRATIANMAPEYGATMGIFPVDAESVAFLRATGRTEAECTAFENYFKAQGMFGMPRKGQIDYSVNLELDLSTVVPSVAGPKRPQDRIDLPQLKSTFHDLLTKSIADGGYGKDDANIKAKASVARRNPTIPDDEEEMISDRPTPDAVSQMPESPFHGNTSTIRNGSVLIAAITSCTNTSNPSVMLAAGLLAKKAVEAGLVMDPTVKTSLAPGSRVVTAYLEKTGLQPYFDKLGFQTVGYGCTTCIGNSGPLNPEVEKAITDNDLIAAAVLSGNRNFEARIHQNIKANFLMSPPLVVAFALAGRVDIDFVKEPIGLGKDGKEIFLKDVWPSLAEIRDTLRTALTPEMFSTLYGNFAGQNPKWNEISAPTGEIYKWDTKSTYIQEPPFFENFGMEAGTITPISGARALGIFGDSVTTDHISPAGAIKEKAPAGRFLSEHGVAREDFNSYGSRRGNDRIMTRGTFANVRIKNLMLPGVEGGETLHQPDGERLSIFDAAHKYAEEKTPLVILAGQEYGTGSSRDWAAKGTRLLGVKAVIAASYERIHRSNLVGMGILPLQFQEGTTAQTLGLDGTESYDIVGLGEDLMPRQDLVLRITLKDGSTQDVTVKVRIDTPIEVDYYRHGGILPFILRQLINEAK
ncbi:MAG: aconitate hydratase AcnA, partial [Verrucomicrobia bacterium]|nr:aconitate hydratase AcnA [Verrucomicrobiota bacterium]